MKRYAKTLTLAVCLFFVFGAGLLRAGETAPAPFGAAVLSGHLGDDRLVECSGLDTSPSGPGLLWAINDSGRGPFLYAMGMDGRSRGRVLVPGAENRDWEGLDTFLWQGRPMILIADCGDNFEQYETHTLYIVQEPRLSGERFEESATVPVARKIQFRYPDRNHDAEAVAVDAAAGKVLILTKRDGPPLLFLVPLVPPPGEAPVTARRVAAVRGIPPPSSRDLVQKYGNFRSRPTALDLSPDGRRAVVLTYKHAYLFERRDLYAWGNAFRKDPVLIPLPLPEEQRDLRQREALCFTPDGRALLVTSEGRGAGLFRLEAR